MARAESRPVELHVTGTAERTCPADRVSLRVGVCSSKDSVAEVTSSVSKRLEYILQCLRQNGVEEKNTSVRKFIQRETYSYRMDAEVVVTSHNFKGMEQVCVLLLEKLDDSVCLGTLEFSHSAKCLSKLREQVFAAAVESASEKATEVSSLFFKQRGSPLVIREEETKEWRSEDKESGSRGQDAVGYSQLPRMPTVTASSRVSVSYQLKERNY